MANKERPSTKICRHCQTEIPYRAKVCPQCRKKQKKGVLKWLLIALAAIIVLSLFFSGGEDASVDNPVMDGAEESVSEAFNPAEKTEENKSNVAAPSQTEFRVGDIIQDGDMQIAYLSSGVYREENQFMQPEEGYQYIFIELACSNTGSDGDEVMSNFSFECYADGYAVEQHYGADGGLSAILSPGRSTSGMICFSVPVDAETIEIEYETNFLSDKKLTFLYEGEQTSDIILATNVSRAEDAFVVGDVAATDRISIAYLSCEDWVSDNMFVEPASGNKFISLEFEVENISEADVTISYFDFYCYADGASCPASYFRDDALSATLSAGRKAKGTVSFEVPVDAEIVEVEYETNYWTSSRIVFTAK